MNEWEEKRREEIEKTWENYCIEKEKRQCDLFFLRKDGRAVDLGMLYFLDKIFYQEKEMIREFVIEIFDNNDDVMIHKHILNDRINKILKVKGIKEI